MARLGLEGVRQLYETLNHIKEFRDDLNYQDEISVELMSLEDRASYAFINVRQLQKLKKIINALDWL